MSTVIEYLEEMKKIQINLLSFIDNNDNLEENYQNIIQLFSDYNILTNPHEIELFLLFISRIADSHCRSSTFFSKLERILLYFKDSIQKNFSNQKIFDLFSNNKRILLFLFKEKIIKMDEKIIDAITKLDYINKMFLDYFLPEIKSFLNENNDKRIKTKIQELIKTEIPEDFEEKRKIGENDDFLCRLIQKDSIEDFITHFHKTNFSLKGQINRSIFETNPFLMSKKKNNQSISETNPTLIEYAAFFGSIQIFKFLYKNGVELNSSLWLYAIHSDNPELIQELEENCEKPKSFKESLIEAIKCHHNDIQNYIEDNYYQEKSNKCFKYYNFNCISDCNLNIETLLYYCCKYNYYNIVEILLTKTKVNVNCPKISFSFFFNSIS